MPLRDLVYNNVHSLHIKFRINHHSFLNFASDMSIFLPVTSIITAPIPGWTSLKNCCLFLQKQKNMPTRNHKTDNQFSLQLSWNLLWCFSLPQIPLLPALYSLSNPINLFYLIRSSTFYHYYSSCSDWPRWTRPRGRSSITSKVKNFSSPRRWEWLWGPTSLLSNG